MKELNILWLYPKEMNTYGDYGNLLTLVRRLEWRGYKANVTKHNVGDPLPEKIDLILGGGGQDSNQNKIHGDLLKIAPHLHKLADDGVPMLMVCGLYQLFGKEFILSNGKKLKGVGIFKKSFTKSGDGRIIGNVIAHSKKFGAIYGYENHNGRTHLEDMYPLAITKGKAGNNGDDHTEGAIYNNVIGTYLHGSVLPKNPKLADFLLKTALENRYNEKIEFEELQLDTDITNKARKVLATRPR